MVSLFDSSVTWWVWHNIIPLEDQSVIVASVVVVAIVYIGRAWVTDANYELLWWVKRSIELTESVSLSCRKIIILSA